MFWQPAPIGTPCSNCRRCSFGQIMIRAKHGGCPSSLIPKGEKQPAHEIFFLPFHTKIGRGLHISGRTRDMSFTPGVCCELATTKARSRVIPTRLLPSASESAELVLSSPLRPDSINCSCESNFSGRRAISVSDAFYNPGERSIQ